MIVYKNRKIPHLFKCGGSSIRKSLIKYDSENIQYISEHDSKFIFDNVAFDWCKDFEYVTVVRHPYGFYESLYNYHRDMDTINAVSTQLDLNYINGKFEFKSMNDWLDANLDMPAFFEEKPYKLKDLSKELCSRDGFQKTWFVGIQLNDFKPEDFVGSMYSLQVEKLLNDNTKVFQMETQLEEFMIYIGLPNKLLKKNITKNKTIKLTQAQKDKIYLKDKQLFKRFGYER